MRPNLAVISSFILAFCGLTYEFVFAQSLSTLLGSSVTQYAVTIGIFLAAMGFGAMYVVADSESRTRLRRQQLRLSVLAPTGFFLLWLSALYFPALLLRIVAYGVVAGIGYLTGAEIPLLMEMAGERERMRILAADYFGMLTASLVFPLVLLPRVGVFAAVLSAGLLNCVVLFNLSTLRKHRLMSLLVAGVLTALLITQPWIRQWMSHQFVASAG